MNYIRPRIFVSYSSKDSEIVHRIRRDLEKAGIDCWIDLSTIGTGDRLQDAIFGEGIPQCNVFFAYITENYLESKWCMKELRQALQSRRVKIVPFADSEQTMQKIPRQVRSEVRCRTLREGLDIASRYTAVGLVRGSHTCWNRRSQHGRVPET
jgi:hypothetical protein